MPLLPTSNLLLMNFRIPRDLKLQFQSACRTRDTFMTAELLRFIRAYLLATPHLSSPHLNRSDPQTSFVISDQRN